MNVCRFVYDSNGSKTPLLTTDKEGKMLIAKGINMTTQQLKREINNFYNLDETKDARLMSMMDEIGSRIPPQKSN